MLKATPPGANATAAPPLFELRLGLLFAALLVPGGVFLPYLPVWLEWIGLSPTEIAVVLGAPMFLRLITTPLISSRADRAADRVHVLAWSLGSSLVLSLGFFLPPSYALALIVSLGLAVTWPAQIGIADAIALSGVRRWGADYPRMRVWGSLSFLAANFAGGFVLAGFGPASVPAMFALSLAAGLVVCAFVPRLGRPRVPAGVAAPGSLLKRRRLVLSLAGAGLIMSSHAFLWSFGSILWQSMGIGDVTIGVLWATGIAAEAALFLAFARFRRVSAIGLVTWAGALAVLRWCLFPLIWPLGFGVAGFLAVQALHAGSTGLVLLAIQKVIAEGVDEHQTGAAQGLAFFASNFAMAIATVASGTLYATMGAGGFFVMAGLAGAGLVCAGLAARSAP